MNQLQDAQQMVGAHAEGVAIAQKDLFRVAAGVVYALQLSFDLLDGKLSVTEMLEQGAEGAAVVRTSHRDRQHERGPLHWRTADLTFIFHTETSLWCLPGSDFLLCRYFITEAGGTQEGKIDRKEGEDKRTAPPFALQQAKLFVYLCSLA